MSLITLEEFRKYVGQQSFSNAFYEKLECVIEDLLESGVINHIFDEDYFFYPKNLWKEEEKLELYFFTPNNILKFTYDDLSINLETRFIKDILDLQLNELNAKNKNVKLTFKFVDDKEFCFSSSDSNQSWKYKYYKAVLEIHSLLRTNIINYKNTSIEFNN